MTKSKKEGRPLKFETVGELQVKIDDYFATNAFMFVDGENVFLPTMAGLARHLEIDRSTLINYGNKEAFFGTVKAARSIVEEVLEQRLFGTAVTGTIFNLKNNFGWKDKQEIEQKVEVNDTSLTDDERAIKLTAIFDAARVRSDRQSTNDDADVVAT